MSTHAKLSPSSSKRWMTCPGSIQLIESLNIEETTNVFAAEGTAAHMLAEKCFKTQSSPEEFTDDIIKVEDMEFTVNQDMIDAVTVYIDYANNTLEEWVFQGCERTIMQVEVNASLKYLNIPGLDGGTADLVLICKLFRIVEIIDYKHGKGVVVEAVNNTQEMNYGLGVLKELGIKKGDNWKVKLTIAQPRAYHPDGPIRSVNMSSDELIAWGDKVLIPAAEATLESDAELVPSDDGCRFCGGSGQCTALYNKTQEIAIADFKEGNFPLPLLMTPEQKMIVMDHAVMIRAFITAVENQVKIEVDQGSTDYELSYKLVRGKTNRKFTDGAFDSDFSPLFEYLNKNDMYEQKQLSLTAIETKLKKEMGIKDAEEVMKGVTFKPEGALVITSTDDKRLEVQPSIVSDFDDLKD